MLALVLGLLAAAAPGEPADPATAESEMLGIDVPDEFEVGHQASNGSAKIVELVQPPETVENWSTLVTLQLFARAEAKDTVATLYERWRGAMRASCPGMTDTSIQGSVDEKAAIRGDLSCPRNPQTNKPENLTAVLVQGDANLMMVQVAFRHPITSNDAALIKRVTGSLKICDQRKFESCAVRDATGFVPDAARQ